MSGFDPTVVPSSLQQSWEAAALKLSEAFGRGVSLVGVSMSSSTPDEIAAQLSEPMVASVVSFQGPLAGDCLLGVPEAHAKAMADLMMGGDGTQPSDEFGELQLSAVAEAFGQGADSLGTKLGGALGGSVTAQAHEAGLGLLVDQVDGLQELAGAGPLFVLTANFSVGDDVPVDMYLMMPAYFLEQIIEAEGGSAAAPGPTTPGAAADNFGGSTDLSDDDLAGVLGQAGFDMGGFDNMGSSGGAIDVGGVLSEDEIAQLLGGGGGVSFDAEPTGTSRGGSPVASGGAAQTARFEDFDDVAARPSPGKIDLVMDIPVPITVELGRAVMRIKDILDLGSGAIVELDKASGEPVDILAGGRPIAKGEVVVVDENFGVRILQILRPIGGSDSK